LAFALIKCISSENTAVWLKM